MDNYFTMFNKLHLLLVCTARVAVITAVGPANLHLLGDQECTWGPSYWCENIKYVQYFIINIILNINIK